MKENLQRLVELTQTPLGLFELAVISVIGLCAFALFTSILINFAELNRRPDVKRRRRSVVATGSMTAFFVIFYLLIRFQVGALQMSNLPLRIALVVFGLVLIVAGCVVNIAGRLSLGRNWANQVTIYEDHKLVTGGIYRVIRHPLYASLIWMFYGASIVYLNLAAFLANTLVFLPFMYYRAKQEEEFLQKEFSDYAEYRRRVGMLFWRWA